MTQQKHIQKIDQSILDKLKPLELAPLPENPLVSVLIANYNYGRYIGEAIESVLNQTYQNFEIVICDDGSTDNSLEVIRGYAERDSRVKYVAKENGGVASALNVAFSYSRGQIISLLDADDLFLPRKLEYIVRKFFSCPSIGFIVHKMQILYGENKGPVIPLVCPLTQGYIGKELYRRGGRWRYMPASTISMRREIADIIFPIDKYLFRTEADGYIYTICPIITSIAFLKKVLSNYRLHGANVTGGGTFEEEDVQKTLLNVTRIIEGTNLRLMNLGLPSLNISYNLTYQELNTFLTLLRSNQKILDQVNQLLELTRRLIDDDLYTFPQKIVFILGYWLTLLMPMSLRSRWLKFLKHPNPFKIMAAKVFR